MPSFVNADAKAGQRREEKFNREVSDAAAALGAVYVEATGSLELWTPLGPLTINPCGDWIATRFTCPKAAATATDCNVYSGKWNFHLYEHGRTVKALPAATLAEFVRRTTAVLALQPSVEVRRQVICELHESIQRTAQWAVSREEYQRTNPPRVEQGAGI